MLDIGFLQRFITNHFILQGVFMNQTITSILERRSIRAFKQEPIPEREVNWILEAGLYAATSRNRQPWFFSVVTNKAIFDKITKGTLETMRTTNIEQYKVKSQDPDFSPFYNAPTVIFLSGKDDESSAAIDCANAAQNMCVAAYSLGLGSCYLRSFRQAFENPVLAAELNKEFGLPDGYSTIFAVALGYASESHSTTPHRNRDVIRYIK